MRILLVSPGFHGYHSAIAAALTVRGHDVSTLVYDDHGGFAGRAWHQLRHELLSKVGVGGRRREHQEQTNRAIAAVAQSQAQAVVIVKGDTLAAGFWHAIATLPRVTWLYDEVRRTAYDREQLSSLGPIATYSAQDADDFAASGWDARWLPLAYDHRLVPTPTFRRNGGISFIGARYPVREQILAALDDRRVLVRAYGRDWSSHPIDRLRTWRVRSPRIPSERDITRSRAYDVMAASAATLNLHGDQDGFTMRTFEAAGVGAVQLIDRRDLGGLYDLGTEVLPWTDIDELTELCRRAVIDSRWTESIRAAARARTLAHHTFDHRVAVLEGAWDTP